MIELPAARTKTRTARRVPVSSRLAARLEVIREAQASPKVLTFSGTVFRFPKVRMGVKKGANTPHPVSGPLHEVREAFNTALETAGLDTELHFHDFRRTFRSHMKIAGVDSFTLNEIDGHANPKIEQTYTRLDDDHLFRAISHLPDWNSHKTSTSDAGQEKGVTL